jgi:hypothetical protein
MNQNETSTAQGRRRPGPLALTRLFGYFPPAVAKVYIVSFRTHDRGRPSKFIVLADNMKSAINKAWEHGAVARLNIWTVFKRRVPTWV